MKLIAGIYIFCFPIMLRAQISLNHSTAGLQVKFGNVLRLVNGTGMQSSEKAIAVKSYIKNEVAILKLSPSGRIGADEFAGVFFDAIPQMKNAVTLWRYKPWNSWSKPIAVTDATKMETSDVQFFYWQYDDGWYGAAVPMSGNGFRTTLGSQSGKWGSKAVSYAQNKNVNEVPAVAIGFGTDAYELFARIYRTALEEMGRKENRSSKKSLPEPLQYIGWCTWNASEMGRNLNEEHIIEGVKTFTDKKFPLRWVLIDDGWFQHRNSQLRSLRPDPVKFPNGFRPLINKLKKSYGIKYTGVWHAFNGYWNGIDPDSELGRQHKNGLFSWTQPERVDVENSPKKAYYFLKPEGDYLYKFYSGLHRYLKGEGFDFLKVDNQLVAERMAVNNYPLFDLSQKMHAALYRSANKYFNGAVINCMDMTADAYLNFGTSAVARAVEDYFPYQKNETYDLQRGNAAAHVVQAVYNSLYFSQMVYPDFDMFQSHNPNAVFHALARTLNNGPVYLTDKPGEQNFELLHKLVFSDGRTIRAQTALLPSEDCLFQVQRPSVFKAFSTVRKTGLLALWNAADADRVSGYYKPADVHGIQGKAFAVYEYFSGKLHLAKAADSFAVALPRMGYELVYAVPVKNGFAAFGLVSKYNAPATILKEQWRGRNVTLQLYEGGLFKAYAQQKPSAVLVQGKKVAFTYQHPFLQINVPVSSAPLVVITW